MPLPTATLLYDVPMGRAFGGSCGMVAHSFKLALSQLGYRFGGKLFPLSDKQSPIHLASTRNVGVRIIFEELFERCVRDAAFRSQRNIVFFNLPYFRDLKIFADADLLLFNSRYLMHCCQALASAQRLALPPMAWLPLPVPQLVFPRGYPSVGDNASNKLVDELANGHTLIHALRPRKSDPISTLSLLAHLNAIALRQSSTVSHPDACRRYDASSRCASTTGTA